MRSFQQHTDTRACKCNNPLLWHNKRECLISPLIYSTFVPVGYILQYIQSKIERHYFRVTICVCVCVQLVRAPYTYTHSYKRGNINVRVLHGDTCTVCVLVTQPYPLTLSLALSFIISLLPRHIGPHTILESRSRSDERKYSHAFVFIKMPLAEFRHV